jgi:hypothetical protein
MENLLRYIHSKSATSTFGKIRKQLLTTRKVWGMVNLLRYIHSRSATITFGFMFSSLMVYTPL